MKKALQICLGMSGGELQVGTCEAKVSVKDISNLAGLRYDQRMCTAGGAMPGYQFVSRVGFAPDGPGDGLRRCVKNLVNAMLPSNQSIVVCRSR